MIQPGDITFIKNINKQLVLNLIRNHNFISAPELSRITGLRPSTILNILNDLSDRSLIKNIGKGDSTKKGGKRPTLWKLNDSVAYVIGLDIEIGELSVVILNLGGKTIAQSTMRIGPIQDLHELIKDINILVNGVIKESNIDRSKIVGMGVAYAGVVNCETGTIIIGDIIPHMNIPLLSELNKFYDFPIIMENNANACAIGAKWLGEAKGKKNFMTILIEFDTNVGGMGIGIVINEELYHGASYCSGELNIHLPKLRDMLENIRNRFNEGHILRNYVSSPEKINIYIMIDAAKQADEVALTFFSILGNLIGKTISSSIALLNPDSVILTGDISSLDDIIINPIRNAIEMEVLSITNVNLEILCGKHGHYCVANGAAALVLDDFFKLPNIYAKKIINSVK
jgi:predicted NBD/HSP70 family sugar kinase